MAPFFFFFFFLLNILEPFHFKALSIQWYRESLLFLLCVEGGAGGQFLNGMVWEYSRP